MGFYFMGPVDVPEYPPARMVRIYVPTRAPAHDRPVLLLFDGQNVFDDEPSFAGGWRAHEAVERLAKVVPQPVVVGIDHGNEKRIGELSPFSFGRVSGRADGFIDWIRRWLLPHLAHHFEVTKDPRRIIVGGSSMGGIGALYAVLSNPQVFGGCIAMSPSLWIAKSAIFQWTERRQVPRDARIYLDAGVREPAGMLRNAQAMSTLLHGKGARRLKYVEDPRGTHSELAWRRRLIGALRFQFGTSKGLPY